MHSSLFRLGLLRAVRRVVAVRPASLALPAPSWLGPTRPGHPRKVQLPHPADRRRGGQAFEERPRVDGLASRARRAALGVDQRCVELGRHERPLPVHQPLLHAARNNLIRGLMKRGSAADLLVFNGEISMLRYRLLLHAAFVQRTVIFETNVTFAGHAKVQHAAMQLTDEERSWYKITLPACTVPRGNRHTVPWLREFALRMEMAEWAATQLPPASFAFVSDVDELLDPATMPPSLPLHGLLHTRAGCVAPSLRHWYYSERCPAKRPWHDAVLFRVDGAWFMHHMTWLRSVRPQLTGRLPFKTDSLPLRKAGSEHCPHSLRTARPSYMGWHLSYALNTQQILSKLRENSHANDSMVRKVLDLPLPEAFVNRSVASCADLCQWFLAHQPLSHHTSPAQHPLFQ